MHIWGESDSRPIVPFPPNLGRIGQIRATLSKAFHLYEIEVAHLCRLSSTAVDERRRSLQDV